VAPQPRQQRGVDPPYPPVDGGGQVPAGRVLVQRLGGLGGEPGRERVRPCGHDSPAANSAIARPVASGADSCGQCPVASRVTSRLPGTASRTNAPTPGGAIASCVHSTTSVGPRTRARSAPLSDGNAA